MQKLLILFLSAMIVENIVFARGMVMGDVLQRTRNSQNIYRFGGFVALESCLAGVLAWAVMRLADRWPVLLTVRWILLMLCVIAAYGIIWSILRWRARQGGTPFESLLAAASFNGAVFAIILLAAGDQLSLLQTMVYCLGSSAGLVLAMLLIHSERERMELSNVPRSFRGFPVTMVYIGILCLAIYGLIGHQLPT